MATAIPPLTLPPFDPNEQPVGPRWTKWLSRFINYLVAANINNPVRKKVLLLHHAGELVHDIYAVSQNLPSWVGNDTQWSIIFHSHSQVLEVIFHSQFFAILLQQRHQTRMHNLHTL